ncbi:MAG TPA: DUF1127 domain-containing protein [Stellaceae bacterium]|jgi:uncharacterized protein YjiS (DUF1127 family)|nr:DUF1127 domain-containing protein [Stellaceae bacterium]
MSLVNLFVAARSAMSGWRRRQQAYGELMSLDDRSLADIGIHRSEIPAVIEGFHEATHRNPQPAVLTAPAAISPRQGRLSTGHRWLPPI